MNTHPLLVRLRDKIGDRLRAGIVLHLAEHALPRGDRIVSVPPSCLWEHRRWPAA